MRVFYIVNKKAGGRLTARTVAPPGSWAFTEGPGHGIELAEGAARAGFDVVAACGGDGTVNEVLNGLMRVDEPRRPALGIVPMGTANDLARCLGLPMRIDAAMSLLERGHVGRMDVGTASGGFGERCFGVSAFAGAAAEMAARANRAGKPLPGLAGYLPWLPGVLRYRADITVAADGEEWRGPTLSVQAANGGFGGGGLPIHPSASLEDGLLDLMIIKAAPLPQTLALLARIPFGRHTRMPCVVRRLARSVDLLGEGVPLALDGEIVGALPAHVKIMPGAVKVVMSRRLEDGPGQPLTAGS